MLPFLETLKEKLLDLFNDNDEHEQCLTQSYMGCPDDIQKIRNAKTTYKIEPKYKFKYDTEIDEYDCSRTS